MKTSIQPKNWSFSSFPLFLSVSKWLWVSACLWWVYDESALNPTNHEEEKHLLFGFLGFKDNRGENKSFFNPEAGSLTSCFSSSLMLLQDSSPLTLVTVTTDCAWKKTPCFRCNEQVRVRQEEEEETDEFRKKTSRYSGLIKTVCEALIKFSFSSPHHRTETCRLSN